MPCRVYVDFDGAIAPDGPIDALFARFADPYRRAIGKEWQQGRLSVSQCMKQQVRFLSAIPTEIAFAQVATKIFFDETSALSQCWRRALIGPREPSGPSQPNITKNNQRASSDGAGRLGDRKNHERCRP